MKYRAKKNLSLTADRSTVVWDGASGAGYKWRRAGEEVTLEEIETLMIPSELIQPVQTPMPKAQAFTVSPDDSTKAMESPTEGSPEPAEGTDDEEEG